MLTSLPRDPVEFTIIGGEGDVVRHAVKYDRNLLLVGERQYMLSGRTPLIRGQASAAIFSSVPGMDTVEPVLLDGMVVFARYSGGRTTLHAMRAGRVVEDPQVLDLTTQAPNAITQRPARLLATATPEAALLLTEDARYCYLVTLTKNAKAESVGGAVWPWTLTVPEESVPTLPGTAGPITFEATTPGTHNPTYAPADYGATSGPTVSFGAYFYGQTAGIVITGDPTSPLTIDAEGTMVSVTTDTARPSGQQHVLSGSPYLNGAVAALFSTPVSSVTFSVGALNNAGSLIMKAYNAAGALLGSVTSTRSDLGFEDLTVTYPNISGVLVHQVAIAAEGAGYAVDNVVFGVGDGGPATEAAAWSVVGVYEHRGVFNHLWQARTLTGSASPWNVVAAYHLTGLDFRARVDYAGWWGTRLGALPFPGYADFDTFSVLSGWDGSFEARADLVPPTYYTDKGFRVPIPSAGSGAMRQRHPLTLVAYRVHYADTSYAKALVGSAIWWQRAAANPAAAPISDGGWAERLDSGTPASPPAPTATADFLSAFPVGLLVHQAGLSLRSVGKHPFTISSVQWMGALHTRSDRG